MPPMFKKILIVCTVNICRRPIAEGLQTVLLDALKLKVEVASAARAARTGWPADARALSVMHVSEIDRVVAFD